MEMQWRRGTVASGGEDIYWELTTTGDDDQRPVVVLSHGAGGTIRLSSRCPYQDGCYIWLTDSHSLSRRSRIRS